MQRLRVSTWEGFIQVSGVFPSLSGRVCCRAVVSDKFFNLTPDTRHKKSMGRRSYHPF